jgi:hypothetical protein
MDFSSFYSLLQALSQPFKNFKNIFNKDFIKERRHLHYGLSFIIVFVFFFFGDNVKELQLEYFPFWAVLLFGWFSAWGINFAREWYYAIKGLAKWDWLDIWAGCYGGLTAAILYLFVK